MSGCSKQKDQKSAESESTKSQQSEKAPDELKDLEKSIEEIFQTLQGPSSGANEDKQNKQGGGQQKEQTKQDGGQQKEQTKQDSGQQKEQTKQDGEQQKDQTKQDSGQQKEQTKQDGGQQKEQTKQTEGNDKSQPKDQWQSISDTVTKMHYQCNDYMPAAAKMGSDRILLDNFSNSLNILTDTANKNNRINTLMAASNLYGFIPDFYSLYKTGSSTEIKRIRHYIRDAILNSATGNWEKASASINKLKSSWSVYKNIISKENQEISTKLDFSINELDKVVTKKALGLIEIKGRVGLSNVNALEKAMEKEAEKTDQSSKK